jgi:hypothetical protein
LQQGAGSPQTLTLQALQISASDVRLSHVCAQITNSAHIEEKRIPIMPIVAKLRALKRLPIVHNSDGQLRFTTDPLIESPDVAWTALFP